MKLFKKIVSIFNNKIGALHQVILNKFLQQNKTVRHGVHKMQFFTPNALNKYRVNTFASKEPDTLTWIDSFKEGSTLWDIGANVGLYSIYAAKVNNCKVFAFEPSVFNLELLAKNININKLSTQITIFPIALSNQSGFNLFKMNNPVWGGALSTFGEDYDQHGNDFKTTFDYTIPGITADKVTTLMAVPMPDYVKIDVDGIEHLILEGCTDILKTVNSVLIEINDDFGEQSRCSEKYLLQSGLVLSDKFYLGSGNHYNQLWVREG
jgi:FkbM family methyltransferase